MGSNSLGSSLMSLSSKLSNCWIGDNICPNMSLPAHITFKIKIGCGEKWEFQIWNLKKSDIRDFRVNVNNENFK